MPSKEGEKQVSFYIDGDEKDQFNALCKTMGVSLSSAMRNFMLKAIQEQSLDIDEAALNPPWQSSIAPQSGVDGEVVKNILKRLDSIERTVPNFEVDELKKVRKEVLSGEFGSMRYRLGVIENQIQDLGGSIVWENKLKEKQLRGDDS